MRRASFSPLSCESRLPLLSARTSWLALRTCTRSVAIALLNSNRFIQYQLVDFLDRLTVERPRVQLLNARKNFVLAYRNPEHQPSLALQLSHLERKCCAHVQQMQQRRVNGINFRSPVPNL